MGFGSDIRRMRKANGYTLRKFAELTNISPTYLSKVEREEISVCSAEVIARMANFLNIDPDITCLKAGKIPAWIKERLFKSPIECLQLLKDSFGGRRDE